MTYTVLNFIIRVDRLLPTGRKQWSEVKRLIKSVTALNVTAFIF